MNTTGRLEIAEGLTSVIWADVIRLMVRVTDGRGLCPQKVPRRMHSWLCGLKCCYFLKPFFFEREIRCYLEARSVMAGGLGTLTHALN